MLESDRKNQEDKERDWNGEVQGKGRGNEDRYSERERMRQSSLNTQGPAGQESKQLIQLRRELARECVHQEEKTNIQDLLESQKRPDGEKVQR